jgi:diaminohydroxyphosphoribosylaminopyrimidine deaminase/5-amino-6-(5-phosphoribosylamino)uracil reductase
MPLDSKLVASADSDLVVFTVSRDARRIAALMERGVRVEVLEADSGRVPLGAVLDYLGTGLDSGGILTLLTETGSRLNTALLSGGFVDRLQVFTSPQILGSDAVPAFQGMDLPVRLADPEVEGFGEDISVSGLLRDPWTGADRT